jgi:putative ABC transport system permease protein
VRLTAIALRNLSRNRRRTALSLLVIAAGTAGLLVTGGFIRFSFGGLEEAIIHGGLGHLEVLPATVADDASPDERSGPPTLDDWERVRTDIESVQGVAGAGGTIHLTGVVSHGEQSSACLGLGVEPDREHRMGFDLRLRGGKDLSSAPPAPGQEQVLLGTRLARALAVQPGGVVTVLVVTPDGTLNAMDMKVEGIVTTGLQELDARLLKMHIASAQRLLQTDRVSSIVVGLTDGSQIAEGRAAVAAQLSRHQSALTVLDWRSRAPFYDQVRALYAGIFFFLGAIIFVLVGLSTSNTLMMSVMERVREIGTLLAVGTSRGQIAALLLMEAVWLGALGGLLGNVLGVAIAVAVDVIGFNMPPPPGAVDPIPLHLKLLPLDMVAAGVLMPCVLALASLLPLARIARLRIVDALGHV